MASSIACIRWYFSLSQDHGRTGLDFFWDFFFDISSILSRNTCLIKLSFQPEKGLEEENRCLMYPQPEYRKAQQENICHVFLFMVFSFLLLLLISWRYGAQGSLNITYSFNKSFHRIMNSVLWISHTNFMTALCHIWKLTGCGTLVHRQRAMLGLI